MIAPERPYGVVTMSVALPAACAGRVAVSVVADTGLAGAATPSTDTAVPVPKPVPVTVTCAPAVGTVDGSTECTVGGAT